MQYSTPLHHAAPLQQAAAKAALRWLPLFILLLVILPLALILGVVRVHLQHSWAPVHSLVILNDADVVALCALGIAAAVPAVLVQRTLFARLKAEAVRTENEAVVYVCEIMAREFAQPLSGTMAYSELLLMDSQNPTESQRRAIEGVQEGVIRLEQLLSSLRDAVQVAQSPEDPVRAADIVVVAVNRRPFRRSAAAHTTVPTPTESPPASKKEDPVTPLFAFRPAPIGSGATTDDQSPRT